MKIDTEKMFLVIHHDENGQRIMKLTEIELLNFLETFEKDYEQPVNVTNILHDNRESITPAELTILEWLPINPAAGYS